MKNKKELFIEAFEQVEDVSIMIIIVQLPAGNKETIINHKQLKEKMDYYKQAYNENLELVHNSEVKIINYLFS